MEKWWCLSNTGKIMSGEYPSNTQSSNFPTGGLVVFAGGTEYLFVVKISSYAKKCHPEDSRKAIKRANLKHVSTEKDSKQGTNAALCLERWLRA